MEITDIDDLNQALDALPASASNVRQAYEALLAGSRRHLATFTNWADR